MVKRILIVLILMPFLILTFAPKKELFHLLQKELYKHGVVISGGKFHENPFGMEIEHPTIFFKGIKIADIDSFSMWTALLYTHGEVDKTVVDPSLKSFIPSHIEKVSFYHSIINPASAKISIDDQDYKGAGKIDLKGRMVRFHFTKIPSKSPLITHLKSNKGGWDYEQHF